MELEIPEIDRKCILEDGSCYEINDQDIRLLKYIGLKYKDDGLDESDLIATGLKGIIFAVNKFSAEKHITLELHKSRCVENAILLHIKNKKAKYEKQNEQEEDNLRLDNPLTADDLSITQLLNAEEREKMNIALSKLSSREKLVLSLRFGMNNDNECKSQKQVAELLGISQTYLDRLERKIIKSIKSKII